MFTHILPLLHKNKRLSKGFLLFCFAFLSILPIYRNFYYSNALLTYERHKAVIEKRSEYFNPWQYRVLCPYIIEGVITIYNATINKIFPLEKKINLSIENNTGTTNETDQFLKLLRTPGAIQYMIIFILFRFIEHLFIFYLSWKLWSFFVKSKLLIFLGINFLALSLGNAVAVADLSFNTYLDIIFYLSTAVIIVYKKNSSLLVPIIICGAFNRETSIMIPSLYFISQTDFTKFKLSKSSWNAIVFPSKQTWLFTALLYTLFFSIFIGLRLYFGYKSQQMWKAAAGLPMLKLNLFSAVAIKSSMELIGTFAVIPLIILYYFKFFPHLLKKWFLFIVPIWFAVHFVSVVAYQTRLFIVPLVIIMIPMLLWLIENEINNSAENKKLTESNYL